MDEGPGRAQDSIAVELWIICELRIVKEIRMRRKEAIIALAVVIVLLQAAPTSSQEPPPGEETGKKFGTIIKNAVNTFLPAVGPFVDAIWPRKADGTTKKKKATEDEVKKKLTAERTKILEEAQGKIKPVGGVAKELKVLLMFLDPSVQAQPKIVAAITRLSASSAPSVDDWAFVSEKFGIAKNFVATIKKVTDAELKVMSSKFLRDKLKKIRQANLDLLDPLEKRIKAKKRDETLEALRDLEKRLSGVSDAVGYLVADMQGDLENLEKWAKGAAGESTSEYLSGFESRLEIAYPTG